MQLTLASIPTNIITGFLGAGKTTAILSLLQRKPANQRWAILVNEFGDVGLDGIQLRQIDGIYLKELPGGCMCCTAGVPMQTALNTLLREARPDRLLIEPTGLGHAKQLLALLTSEYYKAVLDLRATITLVDARQIQNTRYTENDIFNQQLQTADIIMANKTDLYADNDVAMLTHYLATQSWFSGQPVEVLTHAEIPLSWLDNPSLFSSPITQSVSLTQFAPNDLLADAATVAETDIKHSQNTSDGYTAEGWVFGAAFSFQHKQLNVLFASLTVERLKAICRTEHGPMMYQIVAGSVQCELINNANDSRITLITSDDLACDMTQQIQRCLFNDIIRIG